MEVIHAEWRLSMRKIKEVLRLKYDCGISEREIARSCSISRSAVAEYVRRATAAGLSWKEALTLTETQLEERLFPTERLPNSVKRPPRRTASISMTSCAPIAS
jgi:predicted DNA-binding protein YlxM (UPF0122 family)